MQVGTSGNMSSFEERAENLLFSSLEKLTPLNSLLEGMITRYLFSDDRRPMFLLGPKGCGKTFHVMKVLSKAIREKEDFLPAMFIYRQRNMLEPLNPFCLAPKEVWRNRCCTLQSCSSIKGLMQSANAIVYDDVHYTFEGIAKGVMPESELVSFLDEILVNVEKGKKAILISEGLPFYYAQKIGSKELEDLFLRFGLFPKEFRRSNLKEWNEYIERIDYLALKEVPPLRYREWLSLWNDYGIEAEEPVKDLLFYWSTNPRTFIRFVKLFQPKTTITMEDLANKAKEMLPEKLDSIKKRNLKFYEFLLDNFLILESALDPYDFSIALDKVRENPETLVKIYQNLSTITKICRNTVEKLCPYPPSHVDKRKWGKDPFYALRTLRKAGYEVSRVLKEMISREVEEDKIEEMEHLVNLSYTNPKIPKIVCQAYDMISKIRAKEKAFRMVGNLLQDADRFTRHLIVNVHKYYINPSKFVDRSYLILSKPFYDSFISELYEVPTSEILGIKSL